VYNMFQEATNVSHSCPSLWRAHKPADCYTALHHHQADCPAEAVNIFYS